MFEKSAKDNLSENFKRFLLFYGRLYFSVKSGKIGGSWFLVGKIGSFLVHGFMCVHLCMYIYVCTFM